jgi:hypothetical protein
LKSSEDLAQLIELAAFAPRDRLEPLFKETSKDLLLALARNPNLKERDLLRLLERKDLDGDVVRQIAERRGAALHYSVKLALACHPRTPRLVSLPILKFLYLFDLVKVCQTPAVPAHVKVVAEDMILKKVDSVPRGERINLARRAPGSVAAGLLVNADRELVLAALDNPFLLESQVLKVLSLENLAPIVVDLLAQHRKWSHRYYVRLALIRNPMTPLPLVLSFIPNMAVNDLREICLDRRMPEQVRKYILAHCAERLAKKPAEKPSSD